MASTSAYVPSLTVGNVISAPRAHAERVSAYPALRSACLMRSSYSSLSGPLFVDTSRLGTGSKRPLSVGSAKVSETEETDASKVLDNAVKSVQEAWDKVDDKLAIGGLGFAALIVLWASTGLVGAIDKLPFIPDFFEFVGILFSGWFVYRYLLFKPDREELLKLIEDAKSKVTGQ